MFLFVEYISAKICVLVQLSWRMRIRFVKATIYYWCNGWVLRFESWNFGFKLLPLRVYKAFVSNRLLLRSVSDWLFPGMYDDWVFIGTDPNVSQNDPQLVRGEWFSARVRRVRRTWVRLSCQECADKVRHISSLIEWLAKRNLDAG